MGGQVIAEFLGTDWLTRFRDTAISVLFVAGLLVYGVVTGMPQIPPVEHPVVGVNSSDPSVRVILPTTSSIGTSPTAPLREGIAFSIRDTERFRYNLFLLTVRPGGRAKVWRVREGKIERVDGILLPTPGPNEMFGTAPWKVPTVEMGIEVFRNGDTLIVERSEALAVLLMPPGPHDPNIVISPYMSEVENVSNDGTPRPGVLVRFPSPEDLP